MRALITNPHTVYPSSRPPHALRDLPELRCDYKATQTHRCTGAAPSAASFIYSRHVTQSRSTPSKLGEPSWMTERAWCENNRVIFKRASEAAVVVAAGQVICGPDPASELAISTAADDERRQEQTRDVTPSAINSAQRVYEKLLSQTYGSALNIWIS